jgi:uncharacterized membrane protein
MKLPKLSEDAKDWVRIFAVLFLLVWVVAIVQAPEQFQKTIRLDVHIDDKTR